LSCDPAATQIVWTVRRRALAAMCIVFLDLSRMMMDSGPPPRREAISGV
jgi:hypothetical protein